MGLIFSILPTQKSPKSSPLLQLAIQGDLDSIKTLVGRHIASFENSSSLVTSYDPNLQRYVNATDNEGNTPLIGAVFKDHTEIVSFLLEKCGADYRIKNNIGCSALWIAAGYSNIASLQYLIDFLVAKAQTTDTDAQTKLDFLSQTNNNGDSPFLAAVSRGHVDAVKVLFQAIRKFAPKHHDDNFVNRQQWRLLCSKNKAGDTPISVAAAAGFEDLSLQLLQMEQKCITTLQNDKLFDTSKTSSSMTNANGLTPLMIASERNYQSIVQQLIEHGVVITLDSKRRSPLAIASFCGCFDVAQYLLSLDISKTMLNDKDINNCTPLWLAARTGNLKMVKLLLDSGADHSIVGAEGLSVFQVAQKYKKESVVSYLQDKHIS